MKGGFSPLASKVNDPSLLVICSSSFGVSEESFRNTAPLAIGAPVAATPVTIPAAAGAAPAPEDGPPPPHPAAIDTTNTNDADKNQSKSLFSLFILVSCCPGGFWWRGA